MRARLKCAALLLIITAHLLGCAAKQEAQEMPEAVTAEQVAAEPVETPEAHEKSAAVEPPKPEPELPELPAEPEEEEQPEDPEFDAAALPEGFSYVKLVNPNILVDLRYAGTNNFTGFVVDGYNSTQAAILRDAAANALSEVQMSLEEDGLGLLIYDAYRPMKASRFFVEWAKSDDERMKEQFYPKLEKSTLFPMGFIAEKSGHSKGITVDLTLVDLAAGEALDMGCEYDLFDDISAHGTRLITDEQAENRLKLKNAMVRHGFVPYSKEWWDYTYSMNSFQGEYFDFDVE